MKLISKRVRWGVYFLLPLFAYNNCGRPGFYANTDNAPNSSNSETFPSSGTDNSSYLLSCISKKTFAKVSDSQPAVKQKWASDLFASLEKADSFVGLKQKASVSNADLELPSTFLVDIDHECLQNAGPQSIITDLAKIKNATAATRQMVHTLHQNDFPSFSAEQFRDAVENDPCISFVDKTASFKLSAVTANDTYIAQQMHLQSISFNSIFERVYNSQNGVNRDVRIAILDSGLDAAHPDLAANVLKDGQGNVVSYNPSANNSDVSDSGFHGTHVAGIAAAVTNNSSGVAGVMGVNAKIIAVKVSPDGKNVNLDDVINGIRWAVDQGAEVINMSFASNRADDDRPSFRAVIEYALSKGVVLVAASGNSNLLITSDSHLYPAKYSALYSGFITVGSVDAASATSARSSFSNYGPKFVKIMAPGQNGTAGVLSTVPAHLNASGLASKANGNPIHGTSMAAPVVAGAAAIAIGMAKSRGYNATPDQIEKLLLQGAQKIGSLSSSSLNGNKLDLLTMVNLLDSDTGISSSTATDRKYAKGSVTIQTQPQNQQALIGTPVEFSVETSASSSILLNYSWTRNGMVIAGEKQKKLKITPTQSRDAGLYEVVIRAGSTIVQSQRVKLELAPTYCP